MAMSKMVRRSGLMLLVLLLALCSFAYAEGTTLPPKVIEAGSISMASASVTVYEGQDVSLSVRLQPEGATKDGIRYVSSNRRIATVSDDGEVTGVKAGRVTVTAILPNGRSARCRVTVRRTSVSMNARSKSMYEGSTLQLVAALKPSAVTGAVSWRSSKPGVAMVDQNGLVTAVKKGTAYIYARLPSGRSASCRITVRPTAVKLSSSRISLYEWGTAQLTASIYPQSSPYQTITWLSSNNRVATVSDTGEITALRSGSTYIIARLNNGQYARCRVTVRTRPSKISQTRVQIYVGSTHKLQISMSQLNPEDVEVLWTSKDPRIATVDDKGTVTAIKAGTTYIYGKLRNGRRLSCKVTVVPYRVTGVTLSSANVQMKIGDTSTLTAEVVPEQATNKSLAWASSDTRVATVADGKITAVGGGSATIMAISRDGNKKAYCRVTVDAPAYRALILGEYTRSGMPKEMRFVKYSEMQMRNALKRSRVNNVPYQIRLDYSCPNKAEIQSQITRCFAAAQEDDVSLIYLTTHGVRHNGKMYLTLDPAWYSGNDMQYAISVSELMNWVNGIKGHVVLVVNACNSGGVVYEAFGVANGIADGASTTPEQDVKAMIGEASKSAARGKITVICSSEWGYSSSWYNGSVKYDYLAAGLTRAMSWDIARGRAMRGLVGDTNRDGVLTSQELAAYAKSYVTALVNRYIHTGLQINRDHPQQVQYFTNDPDLVIFGSK